MNSIRTLSYLHHGDYIFYNKRIYKIDWGLDDNNNVIDIKSNKPMYIDEYEKVKWLRNYNNFILLK